MRADCVSPTACAASAVRGWEAESRAMSKSCPVWRWERKWGELAEPGVYAASTHARVAQELG